MWYDETIKNMAFQRDKVLGSCMTEDEEEAKMLNAILDELKLNALVITDPYNMRHVSGFRGGEGGSKKRGGYTLYSASSSGCFTDNPDFLQLFSVRGEAAVYEFSVENSASREEILNAVSKKLNAEVRFTEEAGGAVSYYCYSDKIGAARAKKIGDCFVNLQVVFRGGETILGVPLVFGGY